MKGTVKFFNEKKGWGFLAPEDGSGDVFCHYSAIKQDGFKVLDEGDTVEFEVVEGPKGRQASAVAVLKK